MTVVVNGDTTVGAQRDLLREPHRPVGATIADGQGQGTITNDDGPVTLGPAPEPTWSAAAGGPPARLDHRAGDAQVVGADLAERLVACAGMRARYSSPRGLAVQSLPGKAAPPGKSEGLPPTIGRVLDAELRGRLHVPSMNC